MKRVIWFVILALAVFGAIYGTGYFIYFQKWMGLVGIAALVAIGIEKGVSIVKDILHSAEPKPENE